jgi:hypothetical protein
VGGEGGEMTQTLYAYINERKKNCPSFYQLFSVILLLSERKTCHHHLILVKFTKYQLEITDTDCKARSADFI